MSISLTCEQCLYGDIVVVVSLSLVLPSPFRVLSHCLLCLVTKDVIVGVVMPYDLICCIALDGLS